MNPSQVKYSSSAVEAVQAEAELIIFRSELPSYNPANNKFVRINLPVAPQGFIDFSDTVLSLKFTNRSHITDTASAAGAAVRTQLSNLIKSVSILNQDSEQIEYINNYNLCVNILDDYTMSVGRKRSVDSILAGGSASGDPNEAAEINGSTTTAAADGSSKTLCDGLMTGFTSGQFLSPLGFLKQGVPCAIVLELEDPATALKFKTTGDVHATPAYAVSDVQLRAKQIKFNSMFNATFMTSMAQAGATGIHYVTESFLHTQNALNSGVSGTQNVNFSMNPRSAKYLVVCHRLESDVTDKDKLSLGTRSSAALTQYSMELNGRQVPSQPIEVSNTNISQAYSQVLDAFGQINNMSHQNLINSASANTSFYSATQGDATKYISALVLEDFNSATNSSTYSGLDLSANSTMAYRPVIGTSLSGAYRLDLICSIDISFHYTADGRCFSVK